MARVGLLQRLAVDAQADVERVRVGDFVGAHEMRSHRGEGVEGFAHHPLRCCHLKIACADVIEQRVAEDVLLPFLGGDVAASGSDDEREFGLVIRLRGVLGQDDGLAGSNDRRGELGEDGGDFRNFHLGFERVIAIIQTDADQFGRSRRRSVWAVAGWGPAG